MRFINVRFCILFFLAFPLRGAAQMECIKLSSGTDDQKVCIGSPITPITYTLGSSVILATITGLPSGVSGFFSSGSFLISGTPSVSGSFPYRIDIVTSGLCTGQRYATGTITVNPLTSASIIYPGSPFCNSLTTIQPVTLTGTPGGIFSSSPAGLNINPATGDISPWLSLPGSYTVTYIVTGCGTSTATAPVSITALPVAAFSYPASQYCSNQSDPLPVFSVGGTAGTFSSTPGLVFVNSSTGQVDLSASTPGTYTVTNTISAAGGCPVVTAATNITINGLPVAAFSYPATPYCSNETDPLPAFTGGGVAGNFTSTPGLVINASTGLVDLSASIPGFYVVTNTVSSGVCGTVIATSSITITQLPSAAISYQGNPFCNNQPGIVPVTFSGTTGGVFSSVPAGLSMNVFSGAITPGTSLPGNYTVTYTISASGGCGTITATAPVSILTSPVLIITNPPAVCSPATVDITSSSVTAGSTPGMIFSYWLDAAATISYPTPQTAGPGTYYIKGTLAAGCFDIKPVLVTVNPSPVAAATNDGPVCVGSPVNLTGGPGGMKSYSWTGPNGFTSNQRSPVLSLSANISMAGIYVLTVTNGSDCTDTAQTRVYVYDVPVANAGAGGTECDLDFILSARPSVGTGLWTLDSGPGTVVFSPGPQAPDARVVVSTYGTYTLRWTETNGPCISSASVIVTFNQQPVAFAGPGGDACSLNFLLNATPSTSGIGTWSMLEGTGTAVFSPNQNTPSATVIVSEYGTKVFRWIVSNGICSDTSDVTVNFYQMPVANAGTGGNNCGLEFNLRAIPSIGTGTWTLFSGPGTAAFTPNANEFAPRVEVNAYGSYVFRWTESNGTCSSFSDVSVTFIQQPSANAGNGGDECDLDFMLNAVQGSVTGTWSLVNGPGNATFSPNANQANARVTVTLPGSYDFAWTEVNSLCTSIDIVRVIFHDKPALNAGTDLLLCKGGNVQLNASGQGTFSWIPAASLSNANIRNPIASPVITTEYTVTLTDRFHCVNTDKVIVEVREQPIADAGPDQVLDFVFDTRLNAGTLKQNETGLWSVVESEGNILDLHAPNSRVTDLSIEDNVLLWTVSNGICPESSDTVHIWVNNLIIPSLITPNQDGNNDFFVIKGLETIGSSSLTIFNRWGGRVYQNDEYDNLWDGVDDKENPLPDDTYFYVIKPASGKAIKGYLVIRR